MFIISFFDRLKAFLLLLHGNLLFMVLKHRGKKVSCDQMTETLDKPRYLRQ